jgi:hypothetical protein
MGIREGLGTDGLVTRDNCNFLPHTVGAEG